MKTTEMDTTPALRRAMHERARELCRATNMRVCRKTWAESDWSPYQRAVASAILGLTGEAHPVDLQSLTAHGRWTMELSVVTAAINEVLNETPEAGNPGFVHGTDGPTDRKDLH